MKYKILTPNKDGNFIFKKEELENLLEEIYNDGFVEGSKWFYQNIRPYGSTYNPTVSCSDPIKIETSSISIKGEMK